MGAPVIIPLLKRARKYRTYMIWLGCKAGMVSLLESSTDSIHRDPVYRRSPSQLFRANTGWHHLHPGGHVRCRLYCLLLPDYRHG
jgi:hypothetical protein